MDCTEKLNEVLNLFSKLYLNQLNSEWIKNVIDADFTEVEDLPIEYEDLHSRTNFHGLFNAIASSIRPIIESVSDEAGLNASYGSKRSSLSVLCTTSICEEDDESRDSFSTFWINMSQSFTIKSLLSFLLYYISRGQRYDASEEVREFGVQAAGLYFLLLALPGSNAFRVFHPILYLKTLDILKLTTKLNIGATSPKKGHHKSSKLSHRKSIDDNIDANDEDEQEMSFLSPAEANKLIRSLNILLNDFLKMTKRFSLKHSPESLEETISVLVEVTRCEIHNGQGMFQNFHERNSVTSLSYHAYVALQNMCVTLHGNVKKTIIIVMKYLLNNVLMIPRGSSDLSHRALGVIREHCLSFIKRYIVIQLGKDAYEAVYILIQHMCLKVPDKADFREKTAKAVIDILKVLPLPLYTQLLKWLFKLSHNEKAGHRLFTLEVISKLLCESERHEESGLDQGSCNKTQNEDKIIESDEATTIANSNNNEVSDLLTNSSNNISVPHNRHILSHKFLLSIIFSRCRDSAATVRSKALSLLAECTLSEKPAIIESIQQIFFQNDTPVVFTTPHIPNNEINCESPIEDFVDVIEFPNAEVVMAMLRRRALDEKVTVRKSALQVMENLMKIYPQMLSVKYLNVLVNHCRDTALFIRKQMVQSIASIVEKYPNNEEVINTWVLGVLPLILDPEVKVQEKVVEHVDALVFRRIQSFTKTEDKLPWNIINAVTKLSFHKFFTKVVLMYSKSEFLRPQLMELCQTHIDHDFNEQSWTLMATLSQYVPIKSPSFALDYFEENCNLTDEIGSYTLQQVLKVLCNGIKHIPHERSLILQETLLQPISNMLVRVEMISSMMDTIALITYKLEGEEEMGQKAIETWASPILKSCDEYLKDVLFPIDPLPLSKNDEEIFFRRLYTLGEVALFCPSKVNKRMFLMLQSIIFHQNHSRNGDEPAIIPTTQTQSSQPPAVTFTPTRRLKALAVVTLGKMCLQHEDQAKRIIPALGRMLDTTTLPAMKINIIFVLSDMCVRYATLVDPLMPQVTACLRDENVQVRRTTLTLLINLLQEDYLKLKGSFFYRVLQCLTDDHEDIRSTVIFFMLERLLKRYPKIFLQHFIECIFHYNCYEEHESYNKFTQTNLEKELFSLAGVEHRDKRMDLYSFMLDHMPDDQRFATTQKLCQDVLGGVVDGRIRLTPSSLPMLEDTLMVLSSEEIKLAWLKSRPEDNDQPTDQAEQAEMAGIVIKKTIISQVVKRNVIENIVPIMIALKHKLAEQRSPLMKQLLLYFKEIMKDYKNEVKEILAGDKQLAKEIEFDLKRLDQEQQRELEEKEAQARQIAQQSISNDGPVYIAKEKVVSLGTSPRLDRRNSLVENLSVEEEEEEVLNSSAAINSVHSSPAGLQSPVFRSKAKSTTLLKQALINSQKVVQHARRVSLCNQNSEQENAEVPLLDNLLENEAPLVEENPVLMTDVPISCDNSHIQENVDSNIKEKIQRSAESIPVYVSPEYLKMHKVNLNCTINLKRITEKSHLKRINNTKSTPENKSTHLCNDNQSPQINRVDLLRAISTPQPNQKVINDVTFINKTQEVSAIGINDSQVSISSPQQESSSSQTLLLHFRSPEVFGKDEAFNKLRKGPKRRLTSEFEQKVSLSEAQKSKSFKKALREKVDMNKTSNVKKSLKRPAGGFMESFNQSEEPSVHNSKDSSDSSFFSQDSSASVANNSPNRKKIRTKKKR